MSNVESLKNTLKECMYQAEVLECVLWDLKASDAQKRRVVFIKDMLNIINQEIEGENI